MLICLKIKWQPITFLKSKLFAVILKIGFNEFSPWLEIAEINGLQAKMAAC